MSALEEILAQKPETFEEAKRGTISEIIQSRPSAVGAGTTQEILRGPQTREVPQVVGGEGIGFSESFKQGFIDDIDIRIRRLAKQKFPNDPNAMQRFGVVDNDIVFVNEQGLLERASGGAADVAGSVAALAPEITGSVVGSFATGNPLTGSAVGAAGGKAFKEFIGGAFFEDPTTPLGVAGDMALEAGLDLAAGGAGRAVGAFVKRRSVPGVTDAAFKSEAKRQAIKEATGIELDVAQVTNMPQLKALKIWARNFPGEAGEIIKANDDLIAGQVDKAVTRVLNTVAKETDTAILGKNAINAADAAITAARTEVASKVSPLYQQAFAETAQVDVKPVLAIIEEKLKTAKGSQRASLLKVKDFLKEPGKKTFDTSIRGLHGTKLAIDEMFEKRGTDALGSTVRRDLTQIKSTLLDQISTASPTYNAAREAFEAETARLVDPLRDGIVGVLAAVPDQRAATAAAKMFADGNVNATAIRAAREAIKKENPEAWNGIVRQWLEHQFNAASKELQTGETLNIAGKFRQRVIGTNAQKDAMRAALGPDASPIFNVTMEALQFASRTPTSSSATAFNQLISETMSGSGIVRPFLQPLQTGVKVLEGRHRERQARLVAEALTDPSKVGQLKILAELSPSKERAVIAGSIIGLSIIPRDLAGNLLFPEGTRIPEILNMQEQQ